MGIAIVGLVGAFVGAAAALIASVLTTRMQNRHEQVRWQRDRRQAAYDGALRYLLRASNRRSEFAAKGGRLIGVLSEDHIREMFDDLVEAQFWLRSLVSVCGTRQAGRLGQAADELDAAVHGIAWSEPATASSAKLDLQKAIRIVGECAREDLGASRLTSRTGGG